MKTTTVRRWGNSIAVRLPKSSARKFGLREGSSVRIVEEEKTRSLSIRPVHETSYTLATLLAKITQKNRHTEIGWGAPRGKEAW